jgi:hypothetical protein
LRAVIFVQVAHKVFLSSLPEYLFFPNFPEAHIRPARYIQLFKVVLDSVAIRNSGFGNVSPIISDLGGSDWQQ